MSDFKKMKKIPLNTQFHPEICEYSIFCCNKFNKVSSVNVPKDLILNDALISTKKRFENIKFANLQSLIDFCKAEKLVNFQLILEWIYFFIYKEERRLFDVYKPENNLIIGINNMIEELKKEKDESNYLNGYKYYNSDTRNLLIKLMVQMMNTNTNDIINEFDLILNKITLNIFNLNFDEAAKNIKEALNIKDSKKIPNEVMPFLFIYQEVVTHFKTSQNSSFFSLNDTVKNIISTFDKMDLPSHIHYMILFIQQKFSVKLQDFLYNKDVSILLKLLYLFKFYPKDDILIYLEKLENFYVENSLLEGLIITGSSKKTINLLENYLNSSDDLLVVVILSKFFVDGKDLFYKKCESELYETLNRLKMFTERIHLNQKLNEIFSHLNGSSKANNVSPLIDRKHLNSIPHSMEVVINCFYCNTKIYVEKQEQFRYTFNNNKEGNEYVSIHL